jgi:glycosyltransferase involved in cell wall biosynthesis
VHDRRWLDALTRLEQDPVFVCTADFPNEQSWIRAVNEASRFALPVIAGPLDLANVLVSHGETVIFLSWGFDLQSSEADLSMLPLFAGVIVDCQVNLQLAHNHGAQNLELIPWGIDIELFTLEGSVMDLSNFGIAKDDKVILSLRAHEPLYRVKDIINAFSACPLQGTLIIGNAGSETAELEQLSKETDKPIVFIPTLMETELPGLLRRASVYVTASENDGTSVTLLQAMACGIPVAASRNSGNRDWVIDGTTGYSFDVGDHEGLCEAVTRAIHADAQITANARQQVLDQAHWLNNIPKLRSLIKLVKQRQQHLS